MSRATTITTRAGRWWGWIAGIALVVGGILLVIALFGDSVEREAGRMPPVSAKPVATAEVHTINEAMLFGAPEPVLAGTRVRLADLRVTRVLGPRVFYVARAGDSIGRQFVVYLPSDPEGAAIEPGIRLDELQGTVREVEDTDVDRWGMAPEEAERVREGRVYLRAEQVTVEARR